MPRYTGRWKARVEQDFDIEAADDEEFETLLEQEQLPSRVVELLDFDVEFLKKDGERV
jgi:hypothetical protein